MNNFLMILMPDIRMVYGQFRPHSKLDPALIIGFAYLYS